MAFNRQLPFNTRHVYTKAALTKRAEAAERLENSVFAA